MRTTYRNWHTFDLNMASTDSRGSVVVRVRMLMGAAGEPVTRRSLLLHPRIGLLQDVVYHFYFENNF